MTDQGRLAELVAELAGLRCWRVATAESLTSGAIASALGAAPDASDWFRGGIVAYSTDVKQRLLNVDSGPVVSAHCATQMARGVAHLVDAEVTVATTGAGGPDPQDGQPPGTVFIAVSTPHIEVVSEHQFQGSPSEVVEQTITHALTMLTHHLG